MLVAVLTLLRPTSYDEHPRLPICGASDIGRIGHSWSAAGMFMRETVSNCNVRCPIFISTYSDLVFG
jgi:hypothetical protein